MNIADFGERNPARPSDRPTPEQYADAETYVRRNAPDLLAMLGFGAA